MSKEKLQSTFADNLRRYRQFRGYSQKELADHLKVNRPSVGSYEECRAFPPIYDFYRISKIMGMSMDSLVKDEIHWR